MLYEFTLQLNDRKEARIMQLNGSQILLEVLKEHGVDTVFGYPGGAILNVYDALYDYKFVGLSHNTLRGAAGGAVLIAELLCAQDYILPKA